METPLVSVIVPIYKVEPYLAQCVDSIINQTYKNLEIILVDDGSPDNCPKMCDEYAKIDSRIVVIHKENGGLSDARNAGLDICKGEWITFVDSDDWIAINSIEQLLHFAQDNNSNLAIGNHEKFHLGDQISGLITESKCEVISQYQALEYLSSKYGLNFTVSWGKLYKHELWTTLRFPKRKLYEDAYIRHIIYSNATNICFVDAPFYKYLQRDDSIMGQTKDPLHALEPRIILYSFLRNSKFRNLTERYFNPLIRDISTAYTLVTNNEKDAHNILTSLQEVIEDCIAFSQSQQKKAHFDYRELCWNIYRSYQIIPQNSSLSPKIRFCLKKAVKIQAKEKKYSLRSKLLLQSIAIAPRFFSLFFPLIPKGV